MLDTARASLILVYSVLCLYRLDFHTFTHHTKANGMHPTMNSCWGLVKICKALFVMPPNLGLSDSESKNCGFHRQFFTQQPFYALNAIKVKIMAAADQ